MFYWLTIILSHDTLFKQKKSIYATRRCTQRQRCPASSFLERKGHVKGKILTYSTATTCTELRTYLWPQKTTWFYRIDDQQTIKNHQKCWEPLLYLHGQATGQKYINISGMVLVPSICSLSTKCSVSKNSYFHFEISTKRDRSMLPWTKF